MAHPGSGLKDTICTVWPSRTSCVLRSASSGIIPGLFRIDIRDLWQPSMNKTGGESLMCLMNSNRFTPNTRGQAGMTALRCWRANHISIKMFGAILKNLNRAML